MPLYEFVCDECNSEIELLIRGDEKPACTACGSPKLTKQFSVPAAHTASGTRLPIMGNCGTVPGGGQGGGCGLPQCGSGGCGA